MAEQLMYNEKDLELIKATFCENNELLVTMRQLFCGIEISKAEKAIIKSTFKNPDLVEAVRHKLYGKNNFSMPIGQISDFWVGTEQQIFGRDKDEIRQAVESKHRVKGMFEKAVALLSNPDGEKVSIEFDSIDEDDLQISLISRNLFLKAVENTLLSLLAIAGKKGETIEQTTARLKADSSK